MGGGVLGGKGGEGREGQGREERRGREGSKGGKRGGTQKEDDPTQSEAHPSLTVSAQSTGKRMMDRPEAPSSKDWNKEANEE